MRENESLTKEEIYKYGLPLVYDDLFRIKNDEEYLTYRKTLLTICQKVLGIFEFVLSCVSIRAKETLSQLNRTELIMLDNVGSKFISIHCLASNDRFVSINGGKKKLIEDSMPQMIIARSIYEMLVMHHFLFVRPANELEQSLLFNLWRINGINNVINYFSEFNDEEIINAENEKKDILEAILNSPLFEENKNVINDIIKSKDNRIAVFDDDKRLSKINITSAWNYLFEDGVFKKRDSHILYNELSIGAHPGYLGLLKYEQQKNEKRDLRAFPFFLSILMLALFVEDVLTSNPQIKKLLYEKYSLEDLALYNTIIKYT